jgi:XrtJ-associated TM-motif-TM protein
MDKAVYLSRNKAGRVALLVVGMLAIPALAHAQGGCTDSPENPTVVLALIGSVGAFVGSARIRIKSRRESTKE